MEKITIRTNQNGIIDIVVYALNKTQLYSISNENLEAWK